MVLSLSLSLRIHTMWSCLGVRKASYLFAGQTGMGMQNINPQWQWITKLENSFSFEPLRAIKHRHHYTLLKIIIFLSQRCLILDPQTIWRYILRLLQLFCPTNIPPCLYIHHFECSELHYSSLQAYSTNLFASYVIQVETERPFAKPFKCCLPFKDDKKRDYCNVFVQRDDGPWTLTYNRLVLNLLCRTPIKGLVSEIPTMQFFTGISRNIYAIIDWGCLEFPK